jgi:hypothetical protein
MSIGISSDLIVKIERMKKYFEGYTRDQDFYLDDNNRLCTHHNLMAKLRFSRIPVGFGQTGAVRCNGVGLETLKNSPEWVLGTFNVGNNNLTSLVGGPEVVMGGYIVTNNPLASLEGLPRSVTKGVGVTVTPTLPVLRLLMIKECAELIAFSPDNKEIKPLMEILNRYKHRGANGVMPCAAEMIKAGFRENARL